MGNDFDKYKEYAKRLREKNNPVETPSQKKKNKNIQKLYENITKNPFGLKSPIEILKQVPLQEDYTQEDIIKNAALGILGERVAGMRRERTDDIGELRLQEREDPNNVNNDPLLDDGDRKLLALTRNKLLAPVQSSTDVTPSYLPKPIMDEVSKFEQVRKIAEDLAGKREPMIFDNRNMESYGTEEKPVENIIPDMDEKVPSVLKDTYRQEKGKKELPWLSLDKNNRLAEFGQGILQVPKGVVNALTFVTDPKMLSPLTAVEDALDLGIIPDKVKKQWRSALENVRSNAEKMVENMGPDYKKYRADKISDYTQGIGSTVGFLLATALMRGANIPAEIGAGIIGAMSQAGDMAYDTYKKTGGDLDKAYMSFLAGLPLGYSEKLGLGRLVGNLETLTSGAFKRVMKEGFREGAEETLQEGFQSFGTALSDNLITGADRDPLKEAIENIQVAAPIGFAFPFGTAGISTVTGKLYEVIKNKFNKQKGDIEQKKQKSVVLSPEQEKSNRIVEMIKAKVKGQSKGKSEKAKIESKAEDNKETDKETVVADDKPVIPQKPEPEITVAQSVVLLL